MALLSLLIAAVLQAPAAAADTPAEEKVLHVVASTEPVPAPLVKMARGGRTIGRCKDESGYCVFDSSGTPLYWMSGEVMGSYKLKRGQEEYNSWVQANHDKITGVDVAIVPGVPGGWHPYTRPADPLIGGHIPQFEIADFIPPDGTLSLREVRSTMYQDGYGLLKLWDELEKDCRVVDFNHFEGCKTPIKDYTDAIKFPFRGLKKRADLLRQIFELLKDYDDKVATLAPLTERWSKKYPDRPDHLEPDQLSGGFLREVAKLGDRAEDLLHKAEALQRDYRIKHGDIE